VSGQDDVEEFAALLRRLKDRTDRSYGSLARRLNMNTSTLHRYCAGDAVPVDFAPAERFAALCGATAEERLELHRLWLGAVTARRRPRTADTAGSAGDPDAAEAAAAEEPGSPGESDADREPGGDSRPKAEDEPDTKGEPDAEGGTAAGSEPGTETGAETGSESGAEGGTETGSEPCAEGGTETGSEPGAEGGTGVESEPGADSAPGPAPDSWGRPGAEAGAAPVPAPVSLPWFRRRRVLVTAAVTAVLLATLGSLSALPSDRPSREDSARAPGGPSLTTAPATPHRPSGTPSASPSGTRSASPSPSSSAKGTTTGGPSGTPTRKSGPPETGGGSAAGDTSVPLTWTADSHVWNQGCGHDYLIGRPPAQVPPPPAAQDARTWAAAQGALHGRDTNVRISVQGRSSTAVVLDALRVRVVARAAPAQGNAYSMDQGCGGALTPRYFSVDLDADRPVARSQPGGDSEGPIPAVRLPYRVSAEDPEVLLVTATTEGCDCGWYLELDWSSQGRTGTVRIDDHGRPFRTSGIKGLPRYTYDTSARQWVPYTG
jgi:hypothetical protein